MFFPHVISSNFSLQSMRLDDERFLRVYSPGVSHIAPNSQVNLYKAGLEFCSRRRFFLKMFVMFYDCLLRLVLPLCQGVKSPQPMCSNVRWKCTIYVGGNTPNPVHYVHLRTHTYMKRLFNVVGHSVHKLVLNFLGIDGLKYTKPYMISRLMLCSTTAGDERNNTERGERPDYPYN